MTDDERLADRLKKVEAQRDEATKAIMAAVGSASTFPSALKALARFPEILQDLRRAEVERDVLEDVVVRAARLCEGRDTAMVLQVLSEARVVLDRPRKAER
jgi:hypothetical protein